MDNPLVIELSPITPAAPGNLVVPVSDGLNPYRSAMIWAQLVGATGGPLDVYIQSQINKTGTLKWVDIAHYAQKAAAAAATEHLIVLAREGQASSGIVAVGSDLTPALAANTVVGGDFGYALRLLFVAGALTTAGGAQQFKFHFSPMGF